MSAITSISDFCNLNLSGGAALQYAPVNWLNYDSYEPILLSGNLQNALTFAAGDWLTMPVLSGSIEWVEAQQSSEQGNAYEQSISFILRNVRVEVEPVLEAMAYLRYVIKLVDRNGKTWLIGTPEHGLAFSSDGSIGRADSGLNSYQVSFSGFTPKRAHGYVPV